MSTFATFFENKDVKKNNQLALPSGYDLNDKGGRRAAFLAN
ncbi:hypothetical protein [Spartinivicinus poritis]|uniref:Uncharacterized protein n=1 Tax=Spartinivicinus poritis TaxID=2994640 RepID=A0ABT5UEK1_9GAMM|nr:hypothetical protein [Spartinivicinus sp. A2-2]MDE1464801.1 hypothetical protein [Spartinivicinus sp. A2-2]